MASKQAGAGRTSVVTAAAMARLVVGSIVLAMAACSGDKAQSRADAPYLELDGDYMAHILPPPPFEPARVARELAAVRTINETGTREQLERAREDAAVTAFRFADVLGTGFNAEAVPITASFLEKVSRELGRYITATKNCWRRPRPFELDDAIHPIEELLGGAMRMSEAPPFLGDDTPCERMESAPSYNFSYPSGHATFGTMTAILLAHMVPEQHHELFERGREYAEARLIGGVHFPSDIEGGHALATAVAALLMQEARFCADLAAARAELRAALGLAAMDGPRGSCAQSAL